MQVLTGTAYTLVMNIDTTDGNSFWWGNSLWQTSGTYGVQTSAYAFNTDLKNQAWNTLGGQTHIMIAVHQQVRVFIHTHILSLSLSLSLCLSLSLSVSLCLSLCLSLSLVLTFCMLKLHY